MHGIAHITGGGLIENIPRILPNGIAAEINRGNWPKMPIFDWIADEGVVPIDEMERTFNMGIGIVMIVAPGATDKIKAILAEQGEEVFEIGRIATQSEATTIRMEG